MSEETDLDPPPAPKRGKALPLMLGMNTLLLAGVIVFLLRKPGPATATAPAAGEAAPAEGSAATGEDGQPGPTVKLDNFIIQLKTVDADRYVRVAFDVELFGEADKPALQARLAPIRDSIISYFTDRTLDELRGSEAMEQTKVMLLKRLKELLPGKHLKAIYITDFVVQ